MGPGLPRRALLAGLALAGCTRREASPEGPAPSPLPAGHGLRDWSFAGPEAQGGSERVVVLMPGGEGPFPVLIALHGRGEAVRGAEAGAYGWARDYRLGEAIGALERGKLGAADLRGQATPERLGALNRALAEAPYRGLVVACPHVPDLTGTRSNDGIERYGRWLVERLLPRLRAECSGAGAVGIDGVSMGGRVALLVGAAHPGVFAAVGSLQAAVQAAEIPDLVGRVRRYLDGNKAGRVRLLTSDGDYFRPAIGALHDALDRERLPHEHIVVAGPHDYSFNQGPGGVEMLLWHDRALRGKASPG